MKVLLVSLNYSPELTGIGKYNGEMCPELVKRDIDITAIVAPPYYPEWEVHNNYSSWMYKNEIIDGVEVTRCPIYIPKNLNTLKRIIHLSSFALSSSLSMLNKIFTKPDVVVLVQPTLFCAPFVLLFCKLTGAKSIMHVQDYEVDAMFGLGMMKEGLLTKLASKIENWLTQKFDKVSTISFSMIEKAKEKGVKNDNTIYFPNWSDINFVNPNTDGTPLKTEWGFNSDDKIVLYAGNISKKQGLEVVLDVAKRFQSNEKLHFVIVGSGSHVQLLQNTAKDLSLNNLHFKPLQEWKRVPEMLSLANIHLVVQKKGVADSVLPSKLTNILSAGGNAIVSAEPNTELYNLSKRFEGIFDCIEPESVELLEASIQNILDNRADDVNTVARQFAEEFLNKSTIIDNFVVDLVNVQNQKVVNKLKFNE